MSKCDNCGAEAPGGLDSASGIILCVGGCESTATAQEAEPHVRALYQRGRRDALAEAEDFVRDAAAVADGLGRPWINPGGGLHTIANQLRRLADTPPNSTPTKDCHCHLEAGDSLCSMHGEED